MWSVADGWDFPMPVTRDQAQMLTALGIACRPTGAPKWDAAGLMAAIGRVNHLALADVIAAVARAASDRTAETPGVLTATTSLHWREKVAERTTPTPPKREDQCHDCGRHLPCGCEHNSAQRPRPASQTAMATALEEARQKLADSHTTQEAS